MINSRTTSKELSFKEMQEEARSSFEYHLEGFRYDLTEQISVALERSGLSKTIFAEKLGVSKGRITQILDGSNNFTLETLAKISEALDAELRLTLRPRGWEQVREFTKRSFDTRVVANTTWKKQSTIKIQELGNKGSLTSKVTDDAFATAA